MREAGQARASGVRNGLEASQHAPGAAHKGTEEIRVNAERKTLIEIANDIRIARKGLEEEGVESGWLNTLGMLAARVEHASRTRQAPEKGVEGRLKAIEEALKTLATPGKT